MASSRVESQSEFGGKKILIVGGTSGVGLACARLFRDRGAREIALMGRDAKRGASALATLGTGLFVQGDANVTTSARRSVAEVERAFGSIDVLVVSTAGAANPALFSDIEAEQIGPILAEQALGPMVMARMVVDGMRARGKGSIVAVASDAAKLATPGETVIGAAMAAIVMFCRALAMETKREGVRVNAVTPSLIADTPITERVMADPFAGKLFGKAAKMAGLGVATAEEVAETIVFLAGEAAAKITGQAISVNGGISAA